ncbi:hypothetical protein AOQ84DRAFT_409085 [Glonium stellatum]|uniref:Cyclin-like f-box protein n=1 Tax=Glonium stellatum TaxID=574774 RepID=A0A8E2EZ28_9PEZI|nr:hypothetical protein AOQ84DRAFT_409085 [Glonium stellatum]
MLFRSLTAVFFFTLAFWGNSAEAIPRRKSSAATSTTTQATAQQQAAQISGGISTATDGSTILDQTVTVNDLNLRPKVSAPADQFTTLSGVTGAATKPNTTGVMGLNVLLHGDGGQSFFYFPNQAVQANLMGVVVLAPDPNLFWGGGSGLQRTDGVAHAQAVNDLILNAMPNVISFNSSQVFFTGVSGGSLLLSGFFIPAQMTNFKGTGVLLNCGGLVPQVTFQDADAVVASTTIHFQSTQSEPAPLQPAILSAIAAYENLATAAGLSIDRINALQTLNNAPKGGHCEFDGKGFSSGIQVMANAFSNVIQLGGNGQVNGIGDVLTGVVGNEKLTFSGAT